jgi:hypothetical protein
MHRRNAGRVNLPKNPASPRSGVATQDTTGTNVSPNKTGALADPCGDTYLVYIGGSCDGLTTSWIAYSDLRLRKRDSANNKCVPGGVFAESYGKDGKQGEKWRWKISGVGRCFMLAMIAPFANRPSGF